MKLHSLVKSCVQNSLIYIKSSQKYSSRQELICPWPQPPLKTVGQHFLTAPVLPKPVPLIFSLTWFCSSGKNLTSTQNERLMLFDNKKAKEECDEQVNHNHRTIKATKDLRGSAYGKLMLRAWDQIKLPSWFLKSTKDGDCTTSQ